MKYFIWLCEVVENKKYFKQFHMYRRQTCTCVVVRLKDFESFGMDGKLTPWRPRRINKPATSMHLSATFIFIIYVLILLGGEAMTL